MKDTILAAAVNLANKRGLHGISRDAVAQAAGVSGGTVTYYFKDVAKLKTAIIKVAATAPHLNILAQAILDKHPAAAGFSEDLRARVAAHLTTGRRA